MGIRGDARLRVVAFGFPRAHRLRERRTRDDRILRSETLSGDEPHSITDALSNEMVGGSVSLQATVPVFLCRSSMLRDGKPIGQKTLGISARNTFEVLRSERRFVAGRSKLDRLERAKLDSCD